MEELHEYSAGPLVRELVEIEARLDSACVTLDSLASEKEDIRRRANAESRGLMTMEVRVAGAEHFAYRRALEVVSGQREGQ